MEAALLLLSFRYDAPFIVYFIIEQLRRPDIYREVCQRVALFNILLRLTRILINYKLKKVPPKQDS